MTEELPVVLSEDIIDFGCLDVEGYGYCQESLNKDRETVKGNGLNATVEIREEFCLYFNSIRFHTTLSIHKAQRHSYKQNNCLGLC